MPSKPRPYEKDLLTLFLSRYEGGCWGDANLDWRDESEDGAVEVIATRQSDGRRLAIEHTLIEPFAGDTRDFQHFKPLLKIEQDETLIVPGRFIYVNVPVRTVQKGYERANVRELHDWLKDNLERLPVGRSEQWCMFSGRRAARRRLDVEVDVDPKSKGCVLIRRYGDRAVNETVRKALTTKVPKLVKTVADRHVLMLEHRAFSVDEISIEEAVRRLAASVQGTSIVDEIWCVESVPHERILRFTHRANTDRTSTLVFSKGRLLSEFQQGIWMPVPHADC